MDEPRIQPTDPDEDAAQPPLPYGKTVSFALEVTLLALLLGTLVEILFDGHPLGINFPVLTWACAGALLLSAYLEGVRPSRFELLLAAPILFLSAMAAVRKEPLTTFLNVVGVLMLFALWVRTFRAGRLLAFGWLDFAISLILVPLEAIFRPWATFRNAWQGVFGAERGRGRGWAILRGVLLALPVVAVFLGLLAAADIVFGAAVERLLEWLDIERILGWVGDGLVIAISGFFFLGALVSALLEPEKRELIGEKRPFLRPFLGLLETGIVLGAVDLLFFIFVLFQVRYLFGGEANITAAGYTYSEYARRGFSELVAVAVLSLGMILLLGMFGKREGSGEVRIFRGLSTALVALLGVILASALMRLLLYENAYGFTRQRTYTHVFIFWMAAGLAVFLLAALPGRAAPFCAGRGAGRARVRRDLEPDEPGRLHRAPQRGPLLGRRRARHELPAHALGGRCAGAGGRRRRSAARGAGGPAARAGVPAGALHDAPGPPRLARLPHWAGAGGAGAGGGGGDRRIHAGTQRVR